MIEIENIHDPEQQRNARRRRVALASLLALALVLGGAAVWLFFWSLGRGLTTPGGVADRESEMLALGAILAGILALATLIAAALVVSTAWSLSKAFWTGLLLALLIVSMWLVIALIRL